MDFLKNLFNTTKYKTNSEAVIIACYYNPQNSPYRLKVFNTFYESIKHLNHRIVECVIGEAKPQLPENANIKRVYTPNLLWHKEALLNQMIKELPAKFKYVFWLDADVVFTNMNWLVEAVEELEVHSVVQPFEYCIHLEKDEQSPSFNVGRHKNRVFDPTYANRRLWRSFCANFHDHNLKTQEQKENYNIHGHVGFAWGARREVLNNVPLYDKALIGGADHIIAHAAVGQIPHVCITKSFTDNLDDVQAWSRRFFAMVGGSVSYVNGDLYHLWHGDIDKREYLKRVQEFTPKTKNITKKDKNGLYITLDPTDEEYVKQYMRKREVQPVDNNGFLTSFGVAYATDDAGIGMMMGGNPAGAILGDMLRDDAQSQPENFGGGQGGGGGATETWVENQPTDQQPSTLDDTPNPTVVSDNYS